MGVSFGCKCKLKDKSNWRVIQRKCNYSHFESPKGQWHPSKYSTIICLKCGAIGRTKAKYVDDLEDYKNEFK